MKHWHIIALASVLIGFGLYYRFHPLVSKVRIGNTVITVEVAATEPQKQKGLGGRQILPDGHGMLFPYDHKEQYSFWMRGMLIPLDFIWIDGSRIVDISENVPPPRASESPLIVKPTVEVNKVLEVNAGTVKRAGIRIGDAVDFIDR